MVKRQQTATYIIFTIFILTLSGVNPVINGAIDTKLYALSFGPIEAVESEQEELETTANRYWIIKCQDCTDPDEAFLAGIPRRVINYWNSNPGKSPLSYRGPDEIGIVTSAAHLEEDLANGIDPIRLAADIDAPTSSFTISEDITIYGKGHSLIAEELIIDGPESVTIRELEFNKLIINFMTGVDQRIELHNGLLNQLINNSKVFPIIALYNNPTQQAKLEEDAYVMGADNLAQVKINSKGITLDRFNPDRIDPASSEKVDRILDKMSELTININPPEKVATVKINGTPTEQLPHNDFIRGEILQLSAIVGRDYEFLEWTTNSNFLSFNSQFDLLMPDTNYQVIANFTEKSDSDKPSDGSSGNRLTDASGNYYETVWIGGKEWMTKNLRASHYNDRTEISSDFPTNSDWIGATEGGYSIYPHDNIDNLQTDAEVVAAYGKLYNWYAVNDTRGLCPAGWSVPNATEWHRLIKYLTDDYQEITTDNFDLYLRSRRQVGSPLGDAYDTVVHPRWDNPPRPNWYGNNQFDFSALPGGLRDDNNFRRLGSYGYWWSSSAKQPDSQEAWYLGMTNFNTHPVDEAFPQYNELSVRCVRNSYPAPGEVSLTIKVRGPGTVEPAVGTHIFSQGQELTVEATAAGSAVFLNWEGEVADSSSSSTTIQLNEDQVITANFAN